jgi:hypothetical protein
MRRPFADGTVIHDLTILSSYLTTSDGDPRYRCRCTCGMLCERSHGALRHGVRHSCGCRAKPCPPRPQNLYPIGHRLGRLVVMRHLYMKKTVGLDYRQYQCRCDCGSVKVFRHGTLRCGTSRSCGCLRRETATRTSVETAKARGAPGSHFKSSVRELYRRYHKGARKRKHAFDLSYDECVALFTSSCHYCGMAPSMMVRPLGKYCTQPPFFANGIDRVDNAEGYTKSNTVPCCPRCNHMKSNRTVEVFLKHVRRIARHALANGLLK